MYWIETSPVMEVSVTVPCCCVAWGHANPNTALLSLFSWQLTTFSGESLNSNKINFHFHCDRPVTAAYSAPQLLSSDQWRFPLSAHIFRQTFKQVVIDIKMLVGKTFTWRAATVVHIWLFPSPVSNQAFKTETLLGRSLDLSKAAAGVSSYLAIVTWAGAEPLINSAI